MVRVANPFTPHEPVTVENWRAFAVIMKRSRAAILALVVILTSPVTVAQAPWQQVNCDAIGTAAVEDPNCGMEINTAQELLLCAANDIGDPTVLGCVIELGNNVKKIRLVADGSAGSYMTTRYEEYRDNMDGTFTLRWNTASSCNCTLINSEVCPYPTVLPECSAAIMAAALAHELCHAKTLATTATLNTNTVPATLTYDDPCELARNEVLCAGIEQQILVALLNGCVPGACFNDLSSRYDIVTAFKQGQEAYVAENCPP